MNTDKNSVRCMFESKDHLAMCRAVHFLCVPVVEDAILRSVLFSQIKNLNMTEFREIIAQQKSQTLI